nr:hypothetical protein [Tanacetum cinerariifolium]
MNAAQPKRRSFAKTAHSYETREKQLRPQLVGFGDLNKTLLKKGNSQNNIDDKGYWICTVIRSLSVCTARIKCHYSEQRTHEFIHVYLVFASLLAFCDYHNMIAILEKSKHNINFHQIVDFIEASHIKYALTINPTVYVSHIRQFWSTARIETTNEGTKILATIDGKPRTIYESSIRRNLNLNDEEWISSLIDTELFENLALMGYNILPNQRFTFQKGQFSHQ